MHQSSGLASSEERGAVARAAEPEICRNRRLRGIATAGAGGKIPDLRGDGTARSRLGILIQRPFQNNSITVAVRGLDIGNAVCIRGGIRSVARLTAWARRTWRVSFPRRR